MIAGVATFANALIVKKETRSKVNVESGSAPVRVLIVGPLPPPLGGIAAYVETLLGCRFPDGLTIAHVDTARDPSTRESLVRRVRSTARVLFEIVRALLRDRPHVVHVHTSSHAAFYEKSVFVHLARLVRARVILHVHGGEFDLFFTRGSWVRQRYIRYVLNSCARVIALSSHWASVFHDLIGVEGDRIATLANGVVLRAVASARKSESSESVSVLMLSVLDERKGVLDLLEAAALVYREHPSTRFILAGPVPGGAEVMERYAQRTRELGIESAVVWAGPVTGRAKSAYLDDADIFALPSHVEGLPIAMLEALGAGAAVVATPVGSIPEAITDGVNGLLVPVKEPHALAAALTRLIGSPEMRARIAHGGRAVAEERYDFARIVEQLANLYTVVARGH